MVVVFENLELPSPWCTGKNSTVTSTLFQWPWRPLDSEVTSFPIPTLAALQFAALYFSFRVFLFIRLMVIGKVCVNRQCLGRCPMIWRVCSALGNPVPFCCRAGGLALMSHLPGWTNYFVLCELCRIFSVPVAVFRVSTGSNYRVDEDCSRFVDIVSFSFCLLFDIFTGSLLILACFILIFALCFVCCSRLLRLRLELRVRAFRHLSGGLYLLFPPVPMASEPVQVFRDIRFRPVGCLFRL